MSYAAVLEQHTTHTDRNTSDKPIWQFLVPFPFGTWQATASIKGLQEIHWVNTVENTLNTTEPLPDKLEQWQSQLQRYLEGKNIAIDRIPIDWEALSGTDFQKRCWLALMTIPRGETRSYGWIAEQVGSPLAVRAVGQANGRNPIPLVIPCHRVIGANGKLAGFMRSREGGLAIKEWLLALERKNA